MLNEDREFSPCHSGIPWFDWPGLSVRISSTRSFSTFRATGTWCDAAMDDEVGLLESDHVGRTWFSAVRLSECNGVEVGWESPADLTLTRMGAFYSPFAPTFVGEVCKQTCCSQEQSYRYLSLESTNTLFEHHWSEHRAASDASGLSRV